MREYGPAINPKQQATSIRDLAAEIAEIDAKIVGLERFIDDLRGDIRLLEDERDDIQLQLDELEEIAA